MPTLGRSAILTVLPDIQKCIKYQIRKLNTTVQEQVDKQKWSEGLEEGGEKESAPVPGFRCFEFAIIVLNAL
jgi:hypothetical protein